MKSVNLAEAKAHLSRLVEEARTGEPICITRRGKPVPPGIVTAKPHRRFRGRRDAVDDHLLAVETGGL
jgi:antitoxin (DNA-binding transcriptional repressor) of toxin-antitoxin stability system